MDPSAPLYVDPSLAGGPVDPDLAPPGRGPEADLDGPGAVLAEPGDLLAALQQEAQRKIVKSMDPLEVDGRAGWAVAYDPNIDAPALEAWQRRATVGVKGRERIDQLRYGCIIVANTATAFLREGQAVRDPHTQHALTFRDPAVWSMYGASDARGAVRAFLGDAGVLAHADAILAEAGYGDTARPVDPTNASSD